MSPGDMIAIVGFMELPPDRWRPKPTPIPGGWPEGRPVRPSSRSPSRRGRSPRLFLLARLAVLGAGALAPGEEAQHGQHEQADHGHSDGQSIKTEAACHADAADHPDAGPGGRAEQDRKSVV